ncbi:MAG: hypothetical protein KR126chlam4_00291 [Candidatus Anoxychlamydiales bacterium]|nr:hypothetical protein [Candidatus Anoxychlamydiales bacterium]NGX40469.1 hypothetical protein [Candidatus Anoxychlamydiales bacterium]HEU64743.1 hypothetical protein [Chlamydiota bacterium]
MLNDIYRKIGKICIYKKKLIFVLITFSFLIGFVLTFSFYKFSKLNDSEKKLLFLEKKSVSTISKRKEIKDFIEKKILFDKSFVEKKLEHLTFLENEKSILSNLLLHPAFSSSSQIKKRISFINSDQNRLKFLEENIKNSTFIKESDLSQLKSLEIDDIDLQKLLSLLEDVQIDGYFPETLSPQLLIKSFTLSKKRENIFSLNMKIFKREFLRQKI